MVCGEAQTGHQCCLGLVWAPEGGGVLGWEKGTDWGPTAAELWLSRPKMAKKKGGCPLIIFDKRGAVRVFASNILHQITIAFKFVLETFQNNSLVKYDTCNTENLPSNADFKGLFLSIHEKRGLYIWRWQNQGCPLSKKGGCSFVVGT